MKNVLVILRNEMFGRFLSRDFSLRPPTAVLMMNMGGPAKSSEVEAFLTRLFSDRFVNDSTILIPITPPESYVSNILCFFRDIINLPLQKWSGPLLAKRRAPAVAKQYDLIGGGSPIGFVNTTIG